MATNESGAKKTASACFAGWLILFLSSHAFAWDFQIPNQISLSQSWDAESNRSFSADADLRVYKGLRLQAGLTRTRTLYDNEEFVSFNYRGGLETDPLQDWGLALRGDYFFVQNESESLNLIVDLCYTLQNWEVVFSPGFRRIAVQLPQIIQNRESERVDENPHYQLQVSYLAESWSLRGSVHSFQQEEDFSFLQRDAALSFFSLNTIQITSSFLKSRWELEPSFYWQAFSFAFLYAEVVNLDETETQDASLSLAYSWNRNLNTSITMGKVFYQDFDTAEDLNSNFVSLSLSFSFN